MQRAARVWGIPFGIGVGYGLVGGLVGVTQWVLTLRDLAERLAEFHATQRRFPGFFDETNVDRGNFWFWIGTGFVASVVMLGLCWLAAFTASRVQHRVRDGVIAALVAAALSGAIYVAATPLAVANSPVPSMTQDAVGCEQIFGVVFYTAAIPFALAGAGMGVRAPKSLTRRRRAE
jgi:cytochrome bd-type quinol oxidase subunit 2